MLLVRILRCAQVNKCSPTPIYIFVSIGINLLIQNHDSFVYVICSSLEIRYPGYFRVKATTVILYACGIFLFALRNFNSSHFKTHKYEYMTWNIFYARIISWVVYQIHLNLGLVPFLVWILYSWRVKIRCGGACRWSLTPHFIPSTIPKLVIKMT
jgi:hypothetical protein